MSNSEYKEHPQGGEKLNKFITNAFLAGGKF